MAAMVRRNILIISLLLLSLPISSSGKVFSILQPAGGLAELAAAPGWHKIYQGALTINGASATMFIYGCDAPRAAVMARLKSAFPSGKDMAQSQTTGGLIRATDRQVLRLLAVALPGADKTVIFALAQSPAAFARSTAAPVKSMIFGDALASLGRPAATIKNEESGAILETLPVAAAAGRLADEIPEKLSCQGWKQVWPAAGISAAKKDFLILQRSAAPAGGRPALCAIMIGPALKESQSCVTFLYKEIKEEQ